MHDTYLSDIFSEPAAIPPEVQHQVPGEKQVFPYLGSEYIYKYKYRLHTIMVQFGPGYMFLPGVRSSGLEFRKRTRPNPGSELGFGERTWPYTGSAPGQTQSSEFGLRVRRKDQAYYWFVRFGVLRKEQAKPWFGIRRKDRAEPWFGRVEVQRKDRAEPWFGRFGVRRKDRAEPLISRFGVQRKDGAEPWFGRLGAEKEPGRTLIQSLGSEFGEREWVEHWLGRFGVQRKILFSFLFFSIFLFLFFFIFPFVPFFPSFFSFFL